MTNLSLDILQFQIQCADICMNLICRLFQQGAVVLTSSRYNLWHMHESSMQVITRWWLFAINIRIEDNVHHKNSDIPNIQPHLNATMGWSSNHASMHRVPLQWTKTRVSLFLDALMHDMHFWTIMQSIHVTLKHVFNHSIIIQLGTNTCMHLQMQRIK